MLTAFSAAHASPNDYDTSSGDGGIARFPAPTAHADGVAHDLAQLPDGSLLVGGRRELSPLLVKLDSAGAPEARASCSPFEVGGLRSKRAYNHRISGMRDSMIEQGWRGVIQLPAME